MATHLIGEPLEILEQSKHFKLIKTKNENPHDERFSGLRYEIINSQEAEDHVISISLHYSGITPKSLEDYYGCNINMGMRMDSYGCSDKYYREVIDILEDALAFCNRVRNLGIFRL